MSAFVSTLSRLSLQSLPFFLLGIVVAGLLAAFVPRAAIERRLGVRDFRPVLSPRWRARFSPATCV